MSEVFEGYERQFSEIFASLSQKCTSAAASDGGIHFSRKPRFQEFSILIRFLVNDYLT